MLCANLTKTATIPQMDMATKDISVQQVQVVVQMDQRVFQVKSISGLDSLLVEPVAGWATCLLPDRAAHLANLELLDDYSGVISHGYGPL
jgi:hypothetical protein